MVSNHIGSVRERFIASSKKLRHTPTRLPYGNREDRQYRQPRCIAAGAGNVTNGKKNDRVSGKQEKVF